MAKCGRPCKGEEQLSRDRILDSAKRLFLEFGYASLSMETIAKDAHVSLRTIYNQFDGKAGLFGALIRRCSDQFIECLTAEQSPEDTLSSFAKEFLYAMTRPEALKFRTMLIGESPRFPELTSQYYEHGPRRTLLYLSDYFKSQQSAGRINHTEAEFLADQFLSALRGERFYRLQLGLEPTPDTETIDSWALQATRLFLRGILF